MCCSSQDTETVLAFWSDSNMMAAMHCLTAAMVWHGEPIKLHILPLKGRQERDYITVSSSAHLVLKHMFRMGVDTQPLSSVPNLDNGPWMELTRDVWDLDNDQLWEMLEALQMETARGRRWHPHMGHPGQSEGPWVWQ